MINDFVASVNTNNSTRWEFFKARWFGKKVIQIDGLNNCTHLRRHKGKFYLVNYFGKL